MDVRNAIITSMEPSRRRRPVSIKAFLSLFEEETMIVGHPVEVMPVQPEEVFVQPHPALVNEPPRQPQYTPKPAPQQPTPQPESVPEYIKPSSGLGWAIVTMLLCCFPIGIVSVVQASKVNDLWFAGKYKEAIDKAESAKKWTVATVVCGIVLYLYWIGVV